MENLLYFQIGEKRLEEIRQVIVEILRDGGAKCGLLMDVNGNLMVRKGFTLIREIESLCVLIAATRRTTREMARILGQDDISIIFHQGTGDHVHSTDVGKNAVLTLLFDDRADIAALQRVVRERLPDLERLLQPEPGLETAELGEMKNLKARAEDKLGKVLGTPPKAPTAKPPKG